VKKKKKRKKKKNLPCHLILISFLSAHAVNISLATVYIAADHSVTFGYFRV
jgi:hypothetical protein